MHLAVGPIRGSVECSHLVDKRTSAAKGTGRLLSSCFEPDPPHRAVVDVRFESVATETPGGL